MSAPDGAWSQIPLDLWPDRVPVEIQLPDGPDWPRPEDLEFDDAG